MYRTDSSNDRIERDPRNDPRTRGQAETEIEIERKSVVADQSREDLSAWPTPSTNRRRTERRRIERMGTDI